MLNLEQVRQFLYYEARLLDDRQWDEWLSCYSPQVVYWMPAWGDDDQLTRDPQKEISLIYYPTAKDWRIASTALKPSAPGPVRQSRGPPISSATLSCWERAMRGLRCATAGLPGAIAISTLMPILALPAAR